MSGQPDRALMRAVAEVVVNEEKARSAADRELATDLARLREVVTEAVTPITARLAELEARPVEKGEKGEKGDAGEPGAVGAPGEKGARGEAGDLGSILLSPELAVEVAAAVRMLHESPAIVERNLAPLPPLPRVTRIERDDDGNFVPVYDGPSP